MEKRADLALARTFAKRLEEEERMLPLSTQSPTPVLPASID